MSTSTLKHAEFLSFVTSHWTIDVWLIFVVRVLCLRISLFCLSYTLWWVYSLNWCCLGYHNCWSPMLKKIPFSLFLPSCNHTSSYGHSWISSLINLAATWPLDSSVLRLVAFSSVITGKWTAFARSNVVVRVVISVPVINIPNNTISNILVMVVPSSLSNTFWTRNLYFWLAWENFWWSLDLLGDWSYVGLVFVFFFGIAGAKGFRVFSWVFCCWQSQLILIWWLLVMVDSDFFSCLFLMSSLILEIGAATCVNFISFAWIWRPKFSP